MAKGVTSLGSKESIKVLITSPAELKTFSRAFYQMEERYLIVAIHPAGRFYSYLDSPQLHLDIDKRGSLLSIQILVPRNDWIVNKQLNVPETNSYSDLRFAGFRQSLPEAVIETDTKKGIVHIIFSDHSAEKQTYSITDQLYVDIYQSEILAGFWILKVIDDRASLKLAEWRKGMKADISDI